MFTADDYARAERFMGYNTNPLVFHAAVRPNWLADSALLPVAARGAASADDRFWYRVTVPGRQRSSSWSIRRARTRERAFDHEKLAAALSTAASGRYTALTLPFSDIELSADGRSVEFAAAKRRWSCDRQGSALHLARRGHRRPARQRRPGRRRGATRSRRPTARSAAFVRDFNLWVRDVAGNRETQLTTDGIKDFAYATNDAGWTRSDVPVVVWSPDSKRIATFRHDSRGVGEMYLVNTVAGHPTLTTLKYPLPGDDKIFMIERVVIDVDQKKVVKIDLPVDPHRSTLCDHIVCGGTWSDVQWSADSKEVAFVSTSRDHKREDMRVADAGDRRRAQHPVGAGRDVLRVRPGPRQLALPAAVERSAVVLAQGRLGRISTCTTRRPGCRRTASRPATATSRRCCAWTKPAARSTSRASARRAGRDPYFRHFYKIGFDGRNQTLLTPEDGDHIGRPVAVGPVTSSIPIRSPDAPPVTVLRDSGREDRRCRSRPATSRSSWPRAGSRRCRSP